MRTARVLVLLAALTQPGTLPVLAQSPVAAAEAAPALKIEGAIPTSLSLTAEDLAKLPRSTAALSSDGNTTTYEGVLLYDLLAKAGWQFGRGMTGKGMASYILATARDGYQVTFTPADIDPLFGNLKVLLADKADKGPLPAREAPFRLIVPGDKMHARSLFSVTKIEVVRLRQ